MWRVFRYLVASCGLPQLKKTEKTVVFGDSELSVWTLAGCEWRAGAPLSARPKVRVSTGVVETR